MDSSCSSDDDSSPSPPQSSPCPTFLDLPPEMIGRIATYVDIFNGDLHNFVAVCGPPLSPIIKHAYMKDNANFLHYVGSADGRTARWRRDNFNSVLARDKLLQWMEVNDGWREAHKPPPPPSSSSSMAGRSTSTAPPLPPIPSVQSEIILRPIESDADEATLEQEIINGAGHLTFEALPPNLFLGANGEILEENYPFDVVIGVDGVDVTKLSFEDTKALILKRGPKTKTLRCLHSVYWCFFLNPAIATDLGLIDVLRNIVEQVGVDVNNNRCRGIQFENGMPLLVRALVHPDVRLFEYLLSLGGIDLNPEIHSSIHIPIFNGMFITLNRSKPLMHVLTKDIIIDALGEADLDVTRVKQLLDKRDNLTNVEDRHGNTPLWHIVHQTFNGNDSYSRNDLFLAKTFLDAGAATDRIELEELTNRRGYRGKMAALIEAKDRAARDNVIASLRPLKRKRGGA